MVVHDVIITMNADISYGMTSSLLPLKLNYSVKVPNQINVNQT